MNCQEIVKKLKSSGSQRNVEGMARFGIRPKTKVFGVPIPELRKIAKATGKDNALALNLWKTGVHEARILAGMIAEPNKLTLKQINEWVGSFDSWDICDQCCMNLLDKSELAKNRITTFAKSKEEFVRRTAFALIAALAFHDKLAKDSYFVKFFPLIKKYSTDERNFVKKAVNWSLRQIGKRNTNLNKKAIKLSEQIYKINSKSAKWIATNAILELKVKKF